MTPVARSPDRTLADYLRCADDKLINLNDVPLFLSSRGTPLTAKSFRETYWASACRAIFIDAHPNQARLWHVTMAVRTIYETSSTESDIRRRIRELIEYMQRRGGQEAMAAYDHYFDAARHADIQDPVARPATRRTGARPQTQIHAHRV